MTKKSYAQARKNLLEACQHYLDHNHAQLEALVAQSPQWPEDDFFQTAIQKSAPTPGFNDWITCHYYQILNPLILENGFSLSNYIEETWDRVRGEGRQKYQGLKFLQGFEPRECIETPSIDPSDPNIVLHNLQALMDLFLLGLYKQELHKDAYCPPTKAELLGLLLKDNANLAQWQRTESNREGVLAFLLCMVGDLDSQSTVGDFFSASNIQFDTFKKSLDFKLTLSDGSIKQVTLNLLDRGLFLWALNDLSRESDGLSFNKVLNDSIRGINLPEKLCNIPLSHFRKNSSDYQETISQILSYHFYRKGVIKHARVECP